MRIAIIAPLVAPLATSGLHGSHAVVVDLARGLSERGHDVLVTCAEGSNIPDLPLATVPIEDEVRRSRIAPGSAPRLVHEPMRAAYERAFALVHAHQPDAVSQHAFDVDAIQLADELPAMHTLHRPPTVASVVDALRRTRSSVFAVSETSGRQWAAEGVGPIGLLPNGVPDLLRWPPGSVQRHAIEPDVVLIAGRVCPEKGTAAGIRAARAAGFQPLVVGSVEDEAYLRSDVAPLLGRTAKIRPVTRPALAAIMGRVAATLMPIEWDDPFGLVAAEAQMAGCPVVAYQRGALAEVVEDGVTGAIVEAGDEGALARALPAVRSLDRRRIRSLALERFSVDRMVGDHEIELRRVAEAARAGSGRPAPLREAG